jgi:hypothetical protein
MQLAQTIKWGAWSLLALNLMMAFGSIWVFMRMAPAIETIIDQNGRSLQACEQMLAALALTDPSNKNSDQLQSAFTTALNRAKNNITEKEEPGAIEAISQHFKQAFAGNTASREETVTSIQHLSQINRAAMVTADQKARQFGKAGAWGIVFMASAVFMAGMLFIKELKRSFIKPIEEIHSVIQAVKTGDTIRRCTGPDAPQDIRIIFGELNDILDENTSHSLLHKKWET